MSKPSERRRLINDLRSSVKNAVPYCLHFKPCPGMTEEQKARLEAELKYSFENWAKTWVLPQIDQIEEWWLGTSKAEEE